PKRAKRLQWSLSLSVGTRSLQKAAGKMKARETSSRPPKEIQAENIWKTAMQKIGRWRVSRKKRKVDSGPPMIKSSITNPGCWHEGTTVCKSKPGETNKPRTYGLC